MKKKIFFCSGGTGGHMFPTLSLMNFLSHEYSVSLFTDSRGISYLKKDFDHKVYTIRAESPFKKNFIKFIFSLIKIFFCIIKSIFILLKERPHLVFGMGGYISYPVCVASKILKIPIILYENNLVLGRANRYLLPISDKLLVNTEVLKEKQNKFKSKTFFVGNILREEILKINILNKKSIKDIITILVLGGSQGAKLFGEVLPEIFKRINDSGIKFRVYQQCKDEQKKALKEFYFNNNIEHDVFAFKENIDELLTKSDLAISRCGASTTAELIYTQTPFIAIPYEFALDNHQYYNAKYYEKKNYCWIMEEKNFNPNNLFSLLIRILQDKSKLISIQNKMKNTNDNFTLTKIKKIINELI